MYIYDNISLDSSWYDKYFTNIVDKFKTQFFIQNIFSENRAVCEVMWKNMVEPDRPQVTI
jgi:hypothetical protein